jgi:DNA helicase II / ATP-dependent DNA helicase PcrA
MSELNEPQQRAVAHGTGPLLVFAGAGSGKTRTITYRIANLVAEGVAPYRILAVTFTNKAAGEMRARVAALAGDEVTRDLWIGTFHSVCARLLRRYHEHAGLKRDFVIYDDSDQKAVVTRALRDLGLGDQEEYAPKLMLSLISREKREGRGPRELDLAGAFPNDAFPDVYARYQRALITANAVDFDDLLLYMARIADDPALPAGQELRSRFHYVLVDEFQDTNLIQYRLIRALSAERGNLCVVGDDDQSIYGWRGADVRLIRSFRRDFAGATVIKLEQNYRSTGNIVRAALGVIEPTREREPKKLWTSRAAGEPVRVRLVRDEREEAHFVVRTIQTEVTRGTPLDEIAIFYRVHAQSRALEEALRSANVPYQVIGGMKFFERAEVKDLLSYLRLITNPMSDADLVRVINTPARGIGTKTVERVLDLASENTTSAYSAIELSVTDPELGTGTRKKLFAFKALIEGLKEEARLLSPHALAVRVLEVTGYRELLRKDDSAESDARLGNLEELVGSIAEYEEELQRSGEEPSLSGYLERVSLVAAVDSLDTAKGVSLMTVHSAKGLEYRAVFLTGMEEEVFPYRGVSHEEIEEIDEERRLAYVAITRARERLTITHAGARTLFGKTRYASPSRFLRDLPADAVVREGTAWPAAQASGHMYGRSPSVSLAPGTRIVERDADDSPADEPLLEVLPGSRVHHKQFGEGVVERVEFGSAPTVVAKFRDHGTKRIHARFLEFE